MLVVSVTYDSQCLNTALVFFFFVFFFLFFLCLFFVFFQAEDGIRDLVRSRGLGDVYKRQIQTLLGKGATGTVYLAKDTFSGREVALKTIEPEVFRDPEFGAVYRSCLLYTSDAADERSSVDLGGRRIIKQKKKIKKKRDST